MKSLFLLMISGADEMTWTRRGILAGAAGLLGTALSAPVWARNGDAQAVESRAFGTSWMLRMHRDVDAAPITAAIEGVVARIDAAMSPYRADSEISHFNRLAGGEVAASAELCAVAGEGLRLAQLSNGAFDPTVGPLVHRYGFGPIEGEAACFADLTVGPTHIGKSRAGVTMDLCGIAKGYALDRMIEAVAALGVTDALIELGGEVRAIGQHPMGRAWQVAVEDPRAGHTELLHVLDPAGWALATSGDRVQSYGFGSRRYGHIIDPRRDGPSRGDIASVTVLAPTAMEADGLATALAVTGPEAGIALCERLGRPTLFVLHEGEGLREIMAAGFQRFMLA